MPHNLQRFHKHAGITALKLCTNCLHLRTRAACTGAQADNTAPFVQLTSLTGSQSDTAFLCDVALKLVRLNRTVRVDSRAAAATIERDPERVLLPCDSVKQHTAALAHDVAKQGLELVILTSGSNSLSGEYVYNLCCVARGDEDTSRLEGKLWRVPIDALHQVLAIF